MDGMKPDGILYDAQEDYSFLATLQQSILRSREIREAKERMAARRRAAKRLGYSPSKGA